MKNLNLLLTMLFPLPCFSQNTSWEQVDWKKYTNNDKGTVVHQSDDFYVVDSIYCYLFDTVLQEDVPNARQYNTAFMDGTGEILESYSQTFDPISGQWTNSVLTINEYDEELNLIEVENKAWDIGDGIWANSERTQNVPNEFGHYTHVLNQKWHAPTSVWRNVFQQKITYNEQGYIQLLDHEEWDTVNNKWNDVFRIAYGSTPEGQVALTIFQLYINGAFENISREKYTYNPGAIQLEVERLAEVWDSSAEEWKPSSRILKEYAPNGNLTTETHQQWDNANENWLNKERFLRNYNANGDVTTKTDLIWNGNQWENFSQALNTYDTLFNLTYFKVSQWGQGIWRPLNSCEFFWRFHHEVVDVQEAAQLDCFFQNPLQNGSLVFCPDLVEHGPVQVSIFDLMGKMVFTKEIGQQNYVNIAQPISAGIYLLNFSNENGLNFTKKIMIGGW